MNYIIEESLFYRTVDGTMWEIDNPENKVVLNVSTNRLLMTLLNHQGVILERDKILKIVWEEYGLNASNNTLNQYISMLRKIFVSFNVNSEVIKTIPKTGFIFNNEISIKIVKNKDASVLDLTKDISILKKNKFSARNHSIFILILVLIILMLASFQFKPKSETSSSLIYNYKGCPVYNIKLYKHDSLIPTIKIINDVISSSKMQCDVSGFFLIHVDAHVINYAKGKVFLSYCMRDDKQHYQCRDYLTNDWKQEHD